jgi:hypothetical protein
MGRPPVRFRDPRSTTYEFVDAILVRCPGGASARAAHVAHVVPAPGGDPRPGRPTLFLPRRLVCRTCGLARTWNGRCVTFSHGTDWSPADPYFGAPLWLRIRTRHGWLWAYNLEHLDLIRRFVQASLRERAPWYDTGRKMTVVARLPVWTKRARNRDEVLRAIGRLHASLAAARATPPGPAC